MFFCLFRPPYQDSSASNSTIFLEQISKTIVVTDSVYMVTSGSALPFKLPLAVAASGNGWRSKLG
jgi:hypothetical protein